MGEGETNAAAAWFLSAADRGNPAARIDCGASPAGWTGAPTATDRTGREREGPV
jgi:hypothetical protein